MSVRTSSTDNVDINKLTFLFNFKF